MPIQDGVGLAIDRIFRNNLLNQTIGVNRGETLNPQPQQPRRIVAVSPRPQRQSTFRGISQIRRELIPPPPEEPPEEEPKPQGIPLPLKSEWLSRLAKSDPELFKRLVLGQVTIEQAAKQDLEKLRTGTTGQKPKPLPSVLTGKEEFVGQLPEQPIEKETRSMGGGRFPVISKEGKVLKGEPQDLAHIIAFGVMPFTGGVGFPSVGAGGLGKFTPKLLKAAKDLPKSDDPMFYSAIDDIINKVIPAQRKARAATSELYSKARAPAFEEVSDVLAAGKGQEGVSEAASKLNIGRLPRAEFEDVQNILSKPQKNAIFNNLGAAPNLPKSADRFNASMAMKRILSPLDYVKDHPQLALQVPPNTPFRDYELKLFKKAWGKQVADQISDSVAKMATEFQPIDPTKFQALESVSSFGKEFSMLPVSQRAKIVDILRRLGGNAIDGLGIIKSLVLGPDFSYLLRQGMIIGVRYPKSWAKAGLRYIPATLREKWAQEMNATLLADPNSARVISKFGLEDGLMSLEKGANWTKRSENVASIFAEKYIPTVRQSGRGAAVFVNKAMIDTARHLEKTMEKMGSNTEDYLEMGGYIKNLLGRGVLPKRLHGLAGQFLNTLFASPRYFSSRVGLITNLASKSKIARQEAWRTLFTYVAAGAGVLALAKAAGAEVEKDPRSPDANKIKIGNQRFDIWVGFAQIERFLAQMITGQRKDTTTGRIEPVNRGDVFERFVRSKESPGIGFLWTLLSGKYYGGGEVDLTSPSGAVKFAKETITPAAIQEMIDAYQLEGMGSAATAALGIAGVGVSTYIPGKLDSWFEKLESITDFTPDQKRTFIDEFDKDSKGWKEFFTSIPASRFGAEERKMYRKQHPDVEANLYFWGEVGELSSSKATALFKEKTKRLGLPMNFKQELKRFEKAEKEKELQEYRESKGLPTPRENLRRTIGALGSPRKSKLGR